jgi:hypothetical protein
VNGWFFVKKSLVKKLLQKRFYHANSPLLSRERGLVLMKRTALATILIVLVAVAVFRRRKKQTLPASST